jgi:hypothetical protein
LIFIDVNEEDAPAEGFVEQTEIHAIQQQRISIELQEHFQ